MGLLPSEIIPEKAAAYVAMNSIFKKYGNYEASKDVNFQITEGRIVALLGPSGSGKTTILRMLAGLEHPDDGDIYIAGQRVNEIVPAKRGIGFVFQNYALFRHMTVFDNIAFGLTVQDEDKGKIERRVTELLDLVGLSNLRDRYPGELSGGQRQRVAFARALAPRPHVLLLDEPFAAIDAKVKHDLRQWLKATIKKSGITSIFVTHDQEEAVELADEIIVTNNGRIEQMGTPEEIYGRPATPFVAGFMGKAKGITNYETLTGFDKEPEFDWAIVRPEFVAVYKKDEDHGNKSAVEPGVVEAVTFQGTRLSMQIRIGVHILEAEQPIETNMFAVGEEVDVLIYRLFLCSNTDVHIVKNKALEQGQVFYI